MAFNAKLRRKYEKLVPSAEPPPRQLSFSPDLCLGGTFSVALDNLHHAALIGCWVCLNWSRQPLHQAVHADAPRETQFFGPLCALFQHHCKLFLQLDQVNSYFRSRLADLVCCRVFVGARRPWRSRILRSFAFSRTKRSARRMVFS